MGKILDYHTTQGSVMIGFRHCGTHSKNKYKISHAIGQRNVIYSIYITYIYIKGLTPTFPFSSESARTENVGVSHLRISIISSISTSLTSTSIALSLPLALGGKKLRDEML